MRLYLPNQILMSDVNSRNILLISKKSNMILFHKAVSLLYPITIWSHLVVLCFRSCFFTLFFYQQSSMLTNVFIHPLGVYPPFHPMIGLQFYTCGKLEWYGLLALTYLPHTRTAIIWVCSLSSINVCYYILLY